MHMIYVRKNIQWLMKDRNPQTQGALQPQPVRTQRKQHLGSLE